MKAIAVAVTALGLLAVMGCETVPKTEAERDALQDEARATLQTMQARDPSLRGFLDKAHGYVIFPSVGKGGVLVGGAYGRGIAYEQGRMIGYAELNQGSLGLQLGGQTFAELLVFESAEAMNRFRSSTFELGGNASIVALNAGAAESAQFTDGVAVFTMPRGGLMADLTLTGQQINFRPLGEVGTERTTYQESQRYHQEPARPQRDRSIEDGNIRGEGEIRLQQQPQRRQDGGVRGEIEVEPLPENQD